MEFMKIYQKGADEKNYLLARLDEQGNNLTGAPVYKCALAHGGITTEAWFLIGHVITITKRGLTVNSCNIFSNQSTNFFYDRQFYQFRHVTRLNFSTE